MLDFILENKIENLCKKSGRRQKRFYNINEVETVLIFFETNDYEAVDAFVGILEKMGKKVISYAYKAKDDNYDYSETPYRLIVHKEDTDWIGIPKSSVVNELKKIQVDVFMDLTITENQTMEYLAASLQTPFKVGLKKTKSLYDLTITNLPKSPNDNVSMVTELGKQILYYLQTIHTLR